jgi:arsenite/tail-anchored protein-transporting ATPase
VPLKAVESEDVRLIMVGGKGGVGKTTCASAIALGAARRGRRVLLVSSDPAPSLSDIFDVEIGDRETPLSGDLPLYGLEISSEMVLVKWKERFGPEIYDVISSFADVDYDFVDYVGTAPGIEEEYMLYFIKQLTEKGEYDLVVWDTAPAGHTLRLLHLPQLFLDHMEAATRVYLNMYHFLERVKDSVRLRSSKTSLLKTIENWMDLSRGIIEFLRNERRTRYVLVTIPEALGVRLTERIMGELRDNRLTVSDLVINHIVKDADCDFHLKRKAMQEKYIHSLEETYQGTNTLKLYLSPYEIRGLERIGEVSERLLGEGNALSEAAPGGQ